MYLITLDDIRNEFERTQSEILVTTQDDGVRASVADTSEDANFEERYYDLKIKLKQWLTRLPVPPSDVQSSTSDEWLNHVLQQQSGVLRQLAMRSTEAGSHNSDSQASISRSGDAVTRLVEEQTVLLRRFTEAGGGANQESRVKLSVVQLPTFDGRTEERKRFSETYIAHSRKREHPEYPKVSIFGHYLVRRRSENNRIN